MRKKKTTRKKSCGDYRPKWPCDCCSNHGFVLIHRPFLSFSSLQYSPCLSLRLIQPLELQRHLHTLMAYPCFGSCSPFFCDYLHLLGMRRWRNTGRLQCTICFSSCSECVVSKLGFIYFCCRIVCVRGFITQLRAIYPILPNPSNIPHYSSTHLLS